MQDIPPLLGWSLNYAVALDVEQPGVAGAFLRASAERRQVISTLLACCRVPLSNDQIAKLADLIKCGTHDEILTAAFGTVPHGLRGALARSGPQPHPKQFYRCLYNLLSAPEHTSAATVIKHLETLDLVRLRILLRLPLELRMVSLVKIISSVRMAADVAKLVHLLASRGVNLTGLTDALGRVSSTDQLADLWDRWCQKVEFPPNPLPRSENYRPIRSGAELRSLALRYRNCAKRYLPQSLEGNAAFGEFIRSGRGAVIHLEKRGEKWIIEGMFGKDNMPLDPEFYSDALSFFAERNIRPVPSERRTAGEWSVLRRLSNPAMLWF